MKLVLYKIYFILDLTV